MLSTRNVLSAIAAGGALFTASQSMAVYQNLSVELYSTVSIDGVDRDVWRVYANFSDPMDQLISIAGSQNLGPMTLQSRNFDDSDFGSLFYNIGSSNAPPSQELIDLNPNREWDTFATIGISVSEQAPYGDQLHFTPGFPAIVGNNYTTSNASWTVVPTLDHDHDPGTPDIPNPQTLAGFMGDNDALVRVMMLQLTVNAGGNVRGTVAVSVRDAGAREGYSIEDQVFNSIPGPAALSLLTVSGVLGVSRRRRVA